VPGQGTEHNLQSVIETVTDIKVMQEQSSAHYFIVKMEDVDDISSLLDIETVTDYISQVAPIPYKNRFYWGSEIKRELIDNGITVAEYPIFVGESFESLSQVYKPYKSSFNANSRVGVQKDEIQGLSFFKINDRNQVMLAYGWYADTDFSGTLVDERLSGIRMRQGNILIGDGRTLAPFYKEARFNAWAVGEVYIVSPYLIPNARRDDFEKNATFSEFTIGLRNTIGKEVSDKIRAASKVRNNPVQKTLKKVEREVANVEQVLTAGFHSSVEKEQIAAGIIATRRDLYAIPKNAPSEVMEQKTVLMERLTTLADDVDESTNFRVKKDVPSNFSKAEKKVLQALMEVLSRTFERTTVDSLYREFLEELTSGGKKQ
jgi:molecular chaperone HtpG